MGINSLSTKSSQSTNNYVGRGWFKVQHIFISEMKAMRVATTYKWWVIIVTNPPYCSFTIDKVI